MVVIMYTILRIVLTQYKQIVEDLKGFERTNNIKNLDTLSTDRQRRQEIVFFTNKR